MKPKARIISAAILLVLLVVVFYRIMFQADPGSLDYHLRAYEEARRLDQSRRGPMKVLSLDYLKWNLKGRPSVNETEQSRNKHEEALIDLGFLEKREIKVQNVVLDRDAERRLSQLVSGGTYTNGWRSYRVYSDIGVLRLVACPGDMQEMVRLIYLFRDAEIIKNAEQIGGPNRYR